LIPSIGGSKCRAGHFWSHERVDLMVWSPPFVDQTEAKAKLTWTGSTRAYITYTDSRQCDIFKALPLGFARRKKLHWQNFCCGTYLETHIFELRVYPASWNVHIASTQYGSQFCGNSFGN
jgi:hypothetical protein